MVDRQFHRDFGNADGAHDAVTGIEQALVFRVLRACAVRFVGIGLAGPRTALHRGERVLRLAENRLSGFGEPSVVRLRRGERLIRLRVRPAIDRLRGIVGCVRQFPRGAVLQRRRKTADAYRDDDEHGRDDAHGDHHAMIMATVAHLIRDVDRFRKGNRTPVRMLRRHGRLRRVLRRFRCRLTASARLPTIVPIAGISGFSTNTSDHLTIFRSTRSSSSMRSACRAISKSRSLMANCAFASFERASWESSDDEAFADAAPAENGSSIPRPTTA